MGKRIARGHLEPSSSNTTFLDALVVPELAADCARSLDRHMDGPGAGLKKLRLLSKGVRAIVQSIVQGYTLKLGDAPGLFKAAPDDPKVAAFLNRYGLLRLRIMIPNLDAGGTGQWQDSKCLPHTLDNCRGPCISSTTLPNVTLACIARTVWKTTTSDSAFIGRGILMNFVLGPSWSMSNECYPERDRAEVGSLRYGMHLLGFDSSIRIPEEMQKLLLKCTPLQDCIAGRLIHDGTHTHINTLRNLGSMSILCSWFLNLVYHLILIAVEIGVGRS